MTVRCFFFIIIPPPRIFFFFFLNDPAPTEISLLPLPAPLPIGNRPPPPRRRGRRLPRLGVPAVPRRPAATRRRPRRRAHRGRARAPRRALRRPVRAVRCAARPGAAQREVLSLVPGTRYLALMLRAGLLWLSEQPRVFRFIRRNGLARRFAARFVAGETVDSGVAALKDLNAAGLSASLDLLGESVHNAAEAQAARDSYLETLDRIKAAAADANVSVKLTQMGLDLDEAQCIDNMRAIITRAQAHGSFVRIDMGRGRVGKECRSRWSPYH